ncbi:MAG TPA: hypothetical protein VN541_15215 [Tepidisphaeraceae bacterium]|nr:hypothetical protein [Tepidisphaeraceae bacterium]
MVIGGVAAILHGSARNTLDVDVCAPLSEPNLSRILEALKGSHPRWRTRPDKPPLADDPNLLTGFKNLYLHTDLGMLDILSEITGIGGFEQAITHAVVLDVGGFKCRVLDLDTLIAAKHAVARSKDREAITELELIRDALRKRDE